MRERSIEDRKGSGMLMVDQMDTCNVQTNIPTGRSLQHVPKTLSDALFFFFGAMRVVS